MSSEKQTCPQWYIFHRQGSQRVYLAEEGGEFSHFILLNTSGDADDVFTGPEGDETVWSDKSNSSYQTNAVE